MKKLAVAISVLALLSGPQPARAEHRDSFTVTGACTALTTGVIVDLQRAQDIVPFPVLGIGGRALVGLVAMDCESSVNGAPLVRSNVTVTGVFIDPARSPGGCQMYDFHWGEDIDGQWFEVFPDLGGAVEIQPDSRFAATLGSVDVEVTGERAPWSMTAITERAEAPTPWVTVHCHLGSRGLVLGTYDHDGVLFTPAVGKLVLGEGHLWDALGAETPAVAAALSAAFTYSGEVELVS